jgi:hypothetical protein
MRSLLNSSLHGELVGQLTIFDNKKPRGQIFFQENS